MPSISPLLPSTPYTPLTLYPSPSTLNLQRQKLKEMRLLAKKPANLLSNKIKEKEAIWVFRLILLYLSTLTPHPVNPQTFLFPNNLLR